MRMITGVLLAALLLLTGCGGDGDEEPKATKSSSPSPSESPTPVQVGLKTTCEMFFGDMGKDSLAQQVLAAANKTTLTPDDGPHFADLADSVRDISERSDPELRPYLDAQAVVLEAFVEDIEAGVGADHDMQDFRASGYEMISRCEEHLLTR